MFCYFVLADTGGYIGLFLGYAILQIPELCFKLVDWAKETFASKGKCTTEEMSDNEANNDNQRARVASIRTQITHTPEIQHLG